MSGSGRGSLVARILFALLATAVVAGALYWGFLRDDETAANTGARVEMNFARLENGPPPTHFDTGQPAQLSQSETDPGSNFVVRGGRLTSSPTSEGIAAAYLSSPDLGAPVTGIGARWSFQTRGATGGAMILLVSQGVRTTMPPTVPPVPIHLVVTPINWNLAVKKDFTSDLIVIAAGQFQQPLAEDGTTVYEASLEIDGSRVTVHLPDGDSRLVNDPRVSQWQGNYASFETFLNHGQTDSVAAFEEVWATSLKDAR